MATSIETALCPLCRRDNNCGNLNASKQTCWCQAETIKFPAALLAKVPDTLKQQACICQRCAREFSQDE